MATTQSYKTLTMPSNADLSASQYRFVVINSSAKMAVVAAAGGDADGVLLNKPAAADRDADFADIDAGGIVEVVAGGSFSAGDLIQSDASGRAIGGTGSADYILGKAYEAATAAGQRVKIKLGSKFLVP